MKKIYRTYFNHNVTETARVGSQLKTKEPVRTE